MFRKTGLEVNKKIFAEACNKYQRQLEFHKSSYYKSKIERAGKNKLFRMVDKLFQLGSSALPSYTSLDVPIEDFNDFFIRKIQSNYNLDERKTRYLLLHRFRNVRVFALGLSG